MNVFENVLKSFKKFFKEKPLIICSPGRVNLIGEHTDYNNGFVLPAAIDKSIIFGILPSEGGKCSVHALDKNERYEFYIDDLHFSKKGWPNYIMGVVDQLKKGGYQIKGFNCVFGGDIPVGAGLSSSAALETGLAFGLNYIYNLGIGELDLVKLAQKAENEFVGVKCGIMDQYVNIFGKNKKVLKIDCRILKHEYYPFDFQDISIVLFNTNVSRALASSEYNKRREDCDEGIKIIKKMYPYISSLREVTIEMIKEARAFMSEVVYKRCKYVVEENNRVLMACEALEKKDLKSFGEYMKESHLGLRDDYQVSCPELDFLLDIVRDEPAVYGSRMMGAGFGGCTINLIKSDSVKGISEYVFQKYEKQFGKKPGVYVTSINSGTHIKELK